MQTRCTLEGRLYAVQTIPGIDTFSEVELQKVASSLQINLIRY